MIDGLALAPDVYAVIADKRAVFLDVNKDRYFKLGMAQTNTLGEFSSAERDRLVAQLIKKGLAADGDAAPPRRGPWRSEAPRRSVSALAVVGACMWAARSLKTRSFGDILHWAHNHCPERAPSRAEWASFFVSRRPFYARDYNCLFDSLALIRFLRLRGAAGEWVFGVRALPFAAHCWVSIDGICVNDDPEFVAPYTPILVL